MKERLLKEGVIEPDEKSESHEKELKLDRLDSKSQPVHQRSSRENYEDILDFDDAASWDTLRAKGIIDFKHKVTFNDSNASSEPAQRTIKPGFTLHSFYYRYEHFFTNTNNIHIHITL